MKFVFALAYLAMVGSVFGAKLLNSTNFDAFVSVHDLSMVAFVMPWCQYCQELEPEYEAASEQLQVAGWPLAQVNCEEDKALCTEHHILIYPTILAFKGITHSIYNGRRNTRAITSFMKRHSQSTLTTLSSKEGLLEFRAKDDITVVAYIGGGDEHSKQIFQQAAEEYADKFTFGTSFNDIFGVENIIPPAIVVYKPFDEGMNIYDGEFDGEKIDEFLYRAVTPAIQQVGKDVHSIRFPGSVPLVFIFADEEPQRKQLTEKLSPLAIETKGKYAWYIIDPNQYPEYASRVALSDGTWPAFGIEDGSVSFKFGSEDRGSVERLDPDTIGRLMADFESGTLKNSIRSEPIRKQQEGAILNVVAEDYNAQVMERDQDVLILYYSPTCTHCKALGPEYQRLADLLEPYNDRIVVAQIDATKNDIEPRPSQYPTVKLFTSDLKKSPIEYDGNRSVSDFLRFMKEHGSPGTTAVLSDSIIWHDEL